MKLRLLLSFIVIQISIYTTFAQNIQRLENAPIFKDITLGTDINRIQNKLEFQYPSNGYKVYRLKESSYRAVYGVQMDYVNVIEKNGRVYGVDAIKIVNGSLEKPTIFNANELESIRYAITTLYGQPTHGLNKETGEFTRFGFQWQASSYQVCCYMDFYGTFQGYKLRYSLSEF